MKFIIDFWKLELYNENMESVERYTLKTLYGDNVHFSVIKHNINGIIKKHWHDYFEIEYFLEGEGETEINGEKYKLEKGVAMLLTPTDYHTVSTKGELTLINVSFDHTLLPVDIVKEIMCAEEGRVIRCGNDKIPDLAEIFETLNYEYRSDNGFKSQAINSLLEYVLITFLRNISFEVKIEQPYDEINKALIYMSITFREDPSLQEVADEVHLNKTYFSELFKKRVGITYIRHLNTLKINYAKKLMKTSGMSAEEIGYNSGFNSLSNFMHTFKKITGMSFLEFKNSKENV